MKIALGNDHTGYEIKKSIMDYLDKRGIEYVDFGCGNVTASDYPDYAKAVGRAIQKKECDKGILICGTGIGISITANKMKGIRCALCHDCFSAEATRLHNDANVLAMGARVIGIGHALKIVETFLNTDFSNEERHLKRIRMMEED
jgi:ribose 5-phosphate isomerase B